MKTYNTAVIGLGKIGLMYDLDPMYSMPSSHVGAYTLHPKFQLVAAVDVRSEQENEIKKLVSNVNYFDQMEAIPDNLRLDVISICTPPDSRLNVIQEIIERFSPMVIFCEKPVANSIKEANQIFSIIKDKELIFIPNLSRRWNIAIQEVRNCIQQKRYGNLLKISLRYTRGIYNTGSHIFDLIRFFAGEITTVRALHQVYTSSELEDEPSYTFAFECNDGEITGFAEAFNDNNYYMFEMDMYLEQGKIEILWSGDEIRYYTTAKHPLFSGYQSLHLEKTLLNCLKDSNLTNAMEHIVQVLEEKTVSICTIEDGIFPLYVADALIRSFHNNSSLEKVGFKDE